MRFLSIPAEVKSILDATNNLLVRLNRIRKARTLPVEKQEFYKYALDPIVQDAFVQCSIIAGYAAEGFSGGNVTEAETTAEITKFCEKYASVCKPIENGDGRLFAQEVMQLRSNLEQLYKSHGGAEDKYYETAFHMMYEKIWKGAEQ
jgi:hypothetical protein